MATANPWNTDVPFSYDALWLGAQECQRWVQEKTSHDPNTHWLNYAIKNYFGPALVEGAGPKAKDAYRCLILGANEGWIERLLCQSGFTGEIVASDVAEKALGRAKEKAREAGLLNVKYVVADLNRTRFEGPFDFVIAEGVLHHIAEIEECLKWLSSCLTPNGYLFASEFEGPVRFQLGPQQVQWINTALSVLPRALRPLPPNGNPLWPANEEANARVRFAPPDANSVIAADPSEAICGPTLRRLIPHFFSVVERNGFGGTLLSYMTGHFDFARTNVDTFAREWLKVLMAIEDALIKTHVLDDEFVFYVLQRKSRAEVEPESPKPLIRAQEPPRVPLPNPPQLRPASRVEVPKPEIPLRYHLADALNEALKRVPVVHALLRRALRKP
jgi:2-polyprenyl-3-methyl-5-hydroxy-6-metoxy-1,4-benzoquinol methylase